MPNWPEDPRRRNVYGDVYGQALPMPGQSQPQGIPSLADLATLVNQQQPKPSGLPSPTFQQQQPAAPSLSQLQPPLMPQSQQAAATDQPQKKPFFSLPDVANALYEGATEQFIPSVKGTVAQLYSGLDRPDLQPEWVQRYQAAGRAAQEMAQRRNEEQAASKALSSTGEAIRQAIPSLPFSLSSMAAALPAGIAGTVATGPVGGALAAGAAAGAAGYRMAASQFLGDAFSKLDEESRKTRGRGMTEQEKAAAYTQLKPIAEHTGLWEAGPEAIGNAAMFGLGRVALGFMPKEAMQNLAKTALGRAGIRAGAAAGTAATEVATETATQVAQGNDQAKADAAIKAFVEGKPMGPAIAGADRPYDGLAGLQKAYNDVVGATLATVVMMGGLAKGAHLAYKPIANRIEAGQRGQEADMAVNKTDPIRTNLEFAREADIADALSRFDEIEANGRLPKAAARRVDAARQQLLGELSLRVSPEAIAAPMSSQRGMAGYLGFSERVNELDDAQLSDLAGRALPDNAEPTLNEAAKRYQAEIGRRQALTDAAAHFEQNPDAVAGVAKTLNDIATGKPMSKGAHGSTAFNLASLSDDMLSRYRLAGEVLLRDHAEALGKQSTAVERSLALLNEESQRRADGQTRDQEAIREADLAERAAAAIAKGKKPNVKGLSFETLDRMANGLEARASLEPRLADSARMLREAAQQGRLRAFNPQGRQQPGIQSAMRGWNAGQFEAPAQPIDFTQDRARLSELAQQADVTSRQRAILAQEEQRRAAREQQRVARAQEVGALNQNPPLAVPQGLPTVTPAAIPQSLGQLGQTRLGIGVDQLPIPAGVQNAETVRGNQGPTSQRGQEGQPGLRQGPIPSSGNLRGLGRQQKGPQPASEIASQGLGRNVTESQGQGRPGQAPPVGVPAGLPGTEAGHPRGTPASAAEPLLRQIPGRLGEQARLSQERGRQKTLAGENAISSVASAQTAQGSTKKPLILWGYKLGTANEPIKISEFTKGEQRRREKAGWKTAAYEQGTEPVGLIEQARLDQSKASTASGGQTGGELAPKTAAQPQPEQRREERQAEAAPLLSQEAEKTRFAEPSNDDEANLEKLGYRLYKGAIRSKAKESQLWAAGWRPYLFDTNGKPAIHGLGIWAKPPSATTSQKQKPASPKANGVSPTWNDANEIERAAMISRSSEKAGAPVSNSFAQRKAAEWKTWADIPEGPAKKRLRDYMNASEQTSMPATMDGEKAASNPYATSEERNEAISRLEKAARNSEHRAIRENADLIGDAVRMGATEAEMMAAIESGDGKALEHIADRQYEKTGGLLLGFGHGKPSRPVSDKKVERHPAHNYKNWENLTDAQVDAFSKAAGLNPGKTRQETLARIDSRKTPAEWAAAWEKAFPQKLEAMNADIGKAETTPNHTESQGKDLDKKADKIESSTEPTPKQNGATDLAERVRAYFLTSLRPLTPNTFWGMADNAFGGTQAQGAYNSKDAYDAMELGLNLALLDQAEDMPQLTAVDATSVKTAVNSLESLQSRLPTQTRRDDEQQRMQQFSTPHTHAHVAAWVANIVQTDEILEPTAGTGNLVAHAKLFGPERIVANELSKRRDELLRQIPNVRVLNENANHLNAILPDDVKPTVVLMNPPFSADINKAGKKDLDVGAIHVEQALQRLQPGGRLVAIVGRGMAMDAPRFSKWWNDIEKQYNVRADVGISGKEYTKFGTSFDNRILVIDKTGPTESRSNIVRGQVEKVSALVDLLQGVRNDRQNPRANAAQQPSAVPASETGAPSAPREAEPGATVPAATGPTVAGSNAENRPRGPAGSARRAGRATTQPSVATADAQPDNAGTVPATTEQSESQGTRGRPAAATAGQPESQRTDAEPVSRVEIGARGAIAPTDQKGFGESRFDAYSPSVSIKNAKPHPTQLAESGAMASVSFPKLTYAPRLPAAIINEGRLSDAQLETIAYAGQSHEMLLPNGERRGFFVGDGTGVGKGAQIAGIILDNWNQGRKKAVWISENARLFNDAQRDAEWVSLGKQRVFEQGKIKGEIGVKEGVAFTTYATLKSAERDKAGQKGKTRLDQLSDWLGKDFEGVIAFDEAHNMANAIARKGSRGVQQGSETARIGIELQKRFPKARIVYVSATGATEVHNLAYASRLGLWGEGTAFSNREAFIDAIHSGGLAAMEVVAKDTKSGGLYTARSLSYDGVEVETLQHDLTAKQREMYDGMARAWQIVLRNVDAAMEAAQSKKNAQARSSALSAFWGAHQRFFNAILTSLSAPSLINDVQSHLDNEHSVVMQLVNTNEATMERRMAQAADTGQELEELDLTPRDILMQYLQNSFPTTLYEEYLDAEGNTKTRPVMDAAGNVVQSPEALAARDRLQEQLATLDVPEGILEQVINHFGSSQVAEITGRKRRLVRQKDGKVTEEKLGASKTKVDSADFDQGKKRILIFSDAGGTGRSYHADLRIPNQQKRIHYLVQPGWRADKAIQGLGRTHRTNQKQPPLVKLVTTTLKSQKRFISSIARRMDQMGALTKGQRDANSQGIFDDDANLENEYSAMALNALFHDIARGKIDGITVADIEREMGLTIIDPKTGQVIEKSIPTVQRFLNRLLSLESESMNRVFDAFDTRRRAMVEYAKQVGSYDAGMESLVAESINKVDDVVAAKHPIGGETRYVKLEAEVKNKIIDFDMLRTAGIQFAKSVKTGKLYAFEEAESVTNPETGDLITRRRRVSTTSTAYVRETDLKNSDHYETVKFTDVGAMRAAWNDEIARTPKTRKETVHLIAGALLPIWDRLPMSSNRVIRAQTDSGERLIGRVIKNNDLSSTLRQLGVGVAAPKLDGKAALSAILDDHSTLVLSNGWRLMRRIVNGSPRMEVVPKEGRLSIGDRTLLEGMGAFSEMVNWQFRTFRPTDNPGIVDRLFASKPLLEVVEPENRRSVPSDKQSNGTTISQSRAQLVAALGDRSVAALERAGKLILHNTDPTRTGAAGYVDPQGAIHLIPSNMDQDTLSVALHEAMHLARDDRFSEGNRAHIRLAHAALKITGLKNFIGNPGFSNLVQQLHRMVAEGDKTAIEALDKARREAPGNVEDEALAYLVQYADEKLPLVRRIIAAIRAALYRMGIKVELTPADVRALALSALKARAKDAALVQTARAKEAFSLPEFAPTEADKAEVERQIAAVKEVRDGQGRLLAPNGKPSNLNERQWKQTRTKFFTDWFGDWENDPRNSSKVVDDNGEPLVVYHGSYEDFYSFDKKYGNDIGFHFGTTGQSNKISSYEGGLIIPAFLSIKNQININDLDRWNFKTLKKHLVNYGITVYKVKRITIGSDYFANEIATENAQNDAVISAIEDAGYDGFFYDNSHEGTGLSYIALSPIQIKSAIGNAGTFSARSNRIDYSQPNTEADTAEQDRLWQEFQAVRAQFQAKQASQSAFDRWFGKGVEGVNSRNGKPLALYHGTNNPEFNQWEESRSGQASRHPTAGLGFFMTADKRSATRYGSRLLELHAKIDNPYYMTDADLVSIEDTQDAARFRRKLQSQGYDAAVISAPGGAPYVVALRSNQIKLASNENPTDSDDFRYSRPGRRQSPPAANPLPNETMGQAALRAVQDRFIRFQVIQDWLKKHGVNLTPDADVYGAESLLPKVTAARTQDAREKILKPLIESAAGKKWSIQGGDLLAAIEDQQPLPTKFKPSIPEFLHAQHAIERNAQIAKIKGAPKDGSGLSDAQAHEILTRYRVMPNFSEFLAMAEKFRAITYQTRHILRTSGIISAEQETAWTNAYKKYVPLKGGPDTASQQTGTGPGISVNPGMKRALGHRLRDENIVENIWRDHERALYLSEKQKVARALRNMLDQANNQNIGTVGQPDKKATLHQGYYHQVWIDGNPLGAYGSYNEAKAAISADAQQSGRPLSKYAVVHKPADPAVVFMSRPMLADNEVALYENGQRIRLQLNDELLARAARNLGVDGAGGLLKAAQSFNRWLSHAYTGYNPEFILANVARDMTTGMINLSGQYGGKFALKTLKGYRSAVRGLWKQIHGKADPWVDRYRAAGGSTGAAYLSDLERIGTDLKRIFQDYQGASETLRQGDRAGAARVAVSDKIRWFGGWIEKMNQVGENALRVATFRAMVEAGHSDAVAARAAGDVTVNFNRKGELTPTLGGLYLFFNPSIQGTKAMWDALAQGAHRGQAMALAGSLTLLALTLAELARGGDDADEEAWKRIPGYVKDRNLVIKMGDIQGTIPIPYGYGAFWSLGNILSDLSHGEDKTKAGIRFASSLFEQFSAIGNPFAGDEADIKNAVSLLPTALKPMMEIAMNRNSLGRPIMPEMSPWNTAQPDSARRWRSTTGSLYDGIASGLNRWTGGNAYQAGAIDISPETLSYLWRTFTGGAGKFAIDSMGLGTRIAQGVSPELREIPVLRKFVRAESIQDARTLFNEQSETVRLAVDAFNAAKRAKDLPAMRQMIDEKRQVLALGKVLQTVQKMIRARRELEDRINQSDLSIEEKRTQLKVIEKQESEILSRFTAHFEDAKQ